MPIPASHDRPRPTITIGRHVCWEYPITAAGHALNLLGPADPDALLDDPDVADRFARDEYMPYWAQPWPAAVMLADYAVQHVSTPTEPVLELGAGLGLLSVALGRAGWPIIATDYDADALHLTAENARRNNVQLREITLLDWRQPPNRAYETIIAADVLYEKRNLEPIADALAGQLAPRGLALVSDPNRAVAEPFLDVLQSRGLRGERIPAFTNAIDNLSVTGTIYRISKI
jgi:predicted nicotinamide N-methyase